MNCPVKWKLSVYYSLLLQFNVWNNIDDNAASNAGSGIFKEFLLSCPLEVCSGVASNVFHHLMVLLLDRTMKHAWVGGGGGGKDQIKHDTTCDSKSLIDEQI